MYHTNLTYDFATKLLDTQQNFLLLFYLFNLFKCCMIGVDNLAKILYRFSHAEISGFQLQNYIYS